MKVAGVRDRGRTAGADSKPGAAHLTQAWLPRTQTFVYNLVRNQRRYRPIALTGEATNLAEFPADPVVVLKSEGVAAPARALRRTRARVARLPTTYDERLVRFARRHGCSVVHAHFGHMGWRALVARRRLEMPLLTTFYGADLAYGRDDPGWRSRYRDLFSEGTLFLCEGPAMGEHLAGIGAPRSRIRIVKIGLDLNLLPYRLRQRAGRPLVILQAGRLVEKKGTDISIRAFAAAGEVLSDSELWLIGDGPQRSRLEQLAAELGVSARVRFLGSLPYAEYREAMARAQIGIQPSRTAADGDTEGGAPTVLLEMQAAGIPVVATRHADIPQVVPAPADLAAEEDVQGVASALAGLATLPDSEWRERSEQGRDLVEREHDGRKVARRVEGLYDEAVGLTR